jgi:hypothetical protein
MTESYTAEVVAEEAALGQVGQGDTKKIMGTGYDVSYGELAEIAVPEETASYKPVPYPELVHNLYKMSNEVLTPKGFSLAGERYRCTHEGNRLFFVHSYQNGDTEAKLAIAGRASYDKSMLIALSFGLEIGLCTNLCMWGDITVMHKATGNVVQHLQDQTILQMHKATSGWDDMRTDRDDMREIDFDVDEGYALMGRIKAHSAKSKSAAARQLVTTKEWKEVQGEWENPTHDHGGRNLWTWYQAFTFRFKDLSPAHQLPRHESLHAFAGNVLHNHRIAGQIEEAETAPANGGERSVNDILEDLSGEREVMDNEVDDR